jgi:hypothetical protein
MVINGDCKIISDGKAKPILFVNCSELPSMGPIEESCAVISSCRMQTLWGNS